MRPIKLAIAAIAFLEYAQKCNFKIIGNTESEFGDVVGDALVKLYL